MGTRGAVRLEDGEVQGGDLGWRKMNGGKKGEEELRGYGHWRRQM